MNTIDHTPQVSVLMTAYNREAFIGEAIRSVIDSTFTDWELIVVDDGSSDGTVRIANNLAAEDSRISVFMNEKNLGDYPNRNKAAGLARGKYLKYLDSDDLLYPHGLEVMVYYMEKYPEAGYGIALPWNREHALPLFLEPAEAYDYNYFKSSIFIRSPLSVIFRKTAFDECGGFPLKRMTSDFEMWHLLSMKFPVVLIPQGLAWYRIHGGQEVSERKKFTLDYLRIAYQYIRNEQCPLNDDRKKQLLTKLRNYKIRIMFRAFRNGRMKEFARIIRI